MINFIIILALAYSLAHMLYIIFRYIIIELLSSILRKKLAIFCNNNLEKIDIIQTYGYQNHKCHWNSYNEYLENKENIEVVAVICTTKKLSSSFIHFINYCKNSEIYYDITLGTLAMRYYNFYKVGFCDFSTEHIENMGERLDELKYWAIDRCFKNKLTRILYKKLQDKYEII